MDSNGRLTAQIDDKALAAINGIVMLAAGTSHYATQIARYWIESLAGVPVACEVASEYHYRQPATARLAPRWQFLSLEKVSIHLWPCGMRRLAV